MIIRAIWWNGTTIPNFEPFSMPAPKPTRIYRITHFRNIPWILDHGVCCRTGPQQDPNFVNIGIRDLIERRAARLVPIPPGGCLHDYVPFYFAPHSVMLYKIFTDQVAGVRAKQEDLVFLVSSIERLLELQLLFLYTNGHAFPENTRYYSDQKDLDKLDWPTILGRDFKKRMNDPDHFRRYQAECLVHRQVPLAALLGFACKGQACAEFLEQAVTECGRSVRIVRKPEWFF